MCSNKTVGTKHKTTTTAKMNTFLLVTLVFKHSQIKLLSIFTCNLKNCECECACRCVFCVPTPAHSSIVLLHGPVSAPSLQFHPLLSQTSHIARRDGDDVRGRGGGRGVDYTHHLSESSSNRMATASISSLLASTSNI